MVAYRKCNGNLNQSDGEEKKKALRNETRTSGLSEIPSEHLKHPFQNIHHLCACAQIENWDKIKLNFQHC